MTDHTLDVQRRPERFLPDPSRVLIRPFIPLSTQQIGNIIGRALSATDAEVELLLADVMREFSGRHLNIENVFQRHFEKIRQYVFTDKELPRQRMLLLGALFTSEYALESAALFNPSIVPHPDQSGVPEGSLRFIMSFRATGEGHISSIEFRDGTIDHQNNISIAQPSRHITTPEVIPNPSYDKATFIYKIREMGFYDGLAAETIETLQDRFSLSELQRSLAAVKQRVKIPSHEEKRAIDCLDWLAESNYEVSFSSEQALSERIIFPISANESNGIEDARFVRFTDENGSFTYYATYTAYNGRVILPQLLSTRDFIHFKIVTLNGRGVQNKGMALFPRRVGGNFAMISRQDNENLYIMFSENIHFWNDPIKLMKPAQSWEFIQLGNCGSPIETERGWLLLTHGVGPMRKYCIGAILLDLNDPSRVIGRLKEPLIKPNENEREGYVPNVVYTCGALLHGRELIIPYAMSDSASSIATVNIDDLLKKLESDS